MLRVGDAKHDGIARGEALGCHSVHGRHEAIPISDVVLAHVNLIGFFKLSEQKADAGVAMAGEHQDSVEKIKFCFIPFQFYLSISEFKLMQNVMKRVEHLLDNYTKKKEEQQTEEPPGSAAETLAKLEEIVKENGWTRVQATSNEWGVNNINGYNFWIDGKNNKDPVLAVIYDDGVCMLWGKNANLTSRLTVAHVRNNESFQSFFIWMWNRSPDKPRSRA